MLVGTDVRLRSAPDPHARVSAVLSYSILRLGGDSRYTATPVDQRATPGRSIGVRGLDLVRSPIDYRAYFVRSEGRWRISV